MTTISTLVCLVVGAASLGPVPNRVASAWQDRPLYAMDSDNGLALSITGPGSVLIEIYLRGKARKQRIDIEMVRDSAYRSVSPVIFERKKPLPKKMGAVGRLGVQVPEGVHAFVLRLPTDQARGALVRLSTPERLPSDVLAGSEQALPQTAAVVPTTPVAPVAPVAPEEASPVVESTIHAANVMSVETDLTTAPPQEPSSRARALRVAVYDLGASELSPQISRVVSDSVLAEVRKLQGVSAIGMKEIQEMLSHEATVQMMSCESNESCLADIAGALGVDNLVTGTLSRVDDKSSAFVLRRIDQLHSQVLGVVNRRLEAAKGDEFLASVGPAIEELFPEQPLREGASRGVPAALAVRLNPPPLSKTVFWSVATATAASAAAGGILGWMAQSARNDYADYLALGTPEGGGQTLDGPTLNDKRGTVESRAQWANALYISSAVLAVASGVVSLFTDWHGYRQVAQ